jgi:hypothetical protein
VNSKRSMVIAFFVGLFFGVTLGQSRDDPRRESTFGLPMAGLLTTFETGPVSGAGMEQRQVNDGPTVQPLTPGPNVHPTFRFWPMMR